MIFKPIYFFLIILLSLPILQSAPKPKDPVKWSPYQGKKNWQDAKEACQNLKMRLPTINELLTADAAGTTSGWKKYGLMYWAANRATEFDEPAYSALNVLNENKTEIHKKDSQLGVSCANVTDLSSAEDNLRELRENNATESEIDSAIESLGSKLFSDFQGEMNWVNANKKCKSLKMRLPTSDELKAAHEDGLLKKWNYDLSRYWSSTSYENRSYSVISISDGRLEDEDKDNSFGVRCHK